LMSAISMKQPSLPSQVSVQRATTTIDAMTALGLIALGGLTLGGLALYYGKKNK